MKKSARKRANRENPELRRDLILQAGRACLRQGGRAGFLLTRVASEAGVSISLVSHYFGGADELFMAVLQSAIAEEWPGKVRKAERLEEANLNLENLISSSFERKTCSRENLLLDLAVYEQALLDAGIRRSLRSQQRMRHARVTAILADVARFRDAEVDPDALAGEFLAFMEGLRLKWCMSNRSGTEREVGAATRFLDERLG